MPMDAADQGRQSPTKRSSDYPLGRTRRLRSLTPIAFRGVPTNEFHQQFRQLCKGKQVLPHLALSNSRALSVKPGNCAELTDKEAGHGQEA